MGYYVDHKAHYINDSEYRIARHCYHPIKCLNSAVIHFKSACKLRMYVCVCLDVYILFCKLYTRT